MALVSFTTRSELFDRLPTLRTNERIEVDAIDSIICQKSAYIISMISDLYEVPSQAQNPIAWAMLQDICIELCRTPISSVLKIVTATGKTNQAPIVTSEQIARDRLEMIREGTLPLPDAVRKEGTSTSFGGFLDTSGVEGIPREPVDRNGRYYGRY